MHLLLSLFLFSSLLVFSVGHTWEPVNVHAEAQKMMRNLGQQQYCQTFPVLGPLPLKYDPLVRLIDTFANNISKLVQTEGTPSITVNLIYDQDILWTQGYGLKNLSDASAGAPNGDTMYMIGSNTKLFTTLLALIAQDKGMLSFTDEVSAHVPDFKPDNPFPSVRSINFNQLASHMAGMPRESPCYAFQSNCDVANDEMWARFQNVTLANPPGFIPEYSNAGFATLGHVVEEIWGEDWSTLIQHEILGPLGMNNSGTNSSDSAFSQGCAIGYTTNNSVASVPDIGWESPAGSMYSTTNDMAKFVSLFFRDNTPYMAQPNQILDSLSIREWRQPRYINVDLTGYGLPWEIYSSPIIYTKGGAINGYLSMTVTIPQLKLGMVVLQSSDAYVTYMEVFEMFALYVIKSFAQILQAVSPAPYIPANFNTFVGVYNFLNTTISISVIQTQYYPAPALTAYGTVAMLQYYAENAFKISLQGVLTDCGTQQDGMETYVYFAPTNPPTFTVPGISYGAVGVKVA